MKFDVLLPIHGAKEVKVTSVWQHVLHNAGKTNFLAVDSSQIFIRLTYCKPGYHKFEFCWRNSQIPLRS